MTWLCRTALAACAVFGLASWSFAGQVSIQIRDGLVTLDAKDATIREIFAEWARVGQTRIVNAERVPGGPMTIQLQDVPERKALDIVLRSIAGYVAAPRAVAAQATASIYDRIVLMPATRPAVVPTGGASPVPSPQSRARSVPEPPPLVVDDDDDQAPAVQMPMPGQPPGAAQPNQPYGNQFGNPYSPPAPGTGGMQPQPQAPQSATRPGLPTAPAPIKPPDPIK
jgi:hypothetical protein